MYACAGGLVRMAAAARVTGATAERAQTRKRDRFREGVPDHAAVHCVPVRCGAVWLHGQGCCAVPSAKGGMWPLLMGVLPKARLCSGRCGCSLCRSGGAMLRCSGDRGLSPCVQGLRYDAGLEGPALPDRGVCACAAVAWLCVCGC